MPTASRARPFPFRNVLNLTKPQTIFKPLNRIF